MIPYKWKLILAKMSLVLCFVGVHHMWLLIPYECLWNPLGSNEDIIWWKSDEDYIHTTISPNLFYFQECELLKCITQIFENKTKTTQNKTKQNKTNKKNKFKI